jgi:hypothetical protein
MIKKCYENVTQLISQRNKSRNYNKIRVHWEIEQNVCKEPKVRRILKFAGWNGPLSTEFSTVFVEKRCKDFTV